MFEVHLCRLLTVVGRDYFAVLSAPPVIIRITASATFLLDDIFLYTALTQSSDPKKDKSASVFIARPGQY